MENRVMSKPKLTVFALDDDPGFLRILEAMFNRIDDWDINLLMFTDWQEGKHHLKNKTVDVILLDYVLGDISGLEILKNIRNTGDERPVIILTAKEDKVTILETTRAGANDFIVKGSLVPELLRRSIHKVLREYSNKQAAAINTQELNHVRKMETVGTLAGGIAHDFNNIIAGIVNNVDLLQEKNSDDSLIEEIEQISAACNQMTEIVQQLMNFSLLDKSNKAALNITKMIEETFVFFKHLLPKKISLSLNLADDKTFYTKCNKGMLHQVLLNLCLNASDAMDGDGKIEIALKTITPQDELHKKYPGFKNQNYICLSVSDEGRGMDSSVKQRIFEPFFTTKSFTNEKGIGLGLSLIWQNIQSCAGAIDVQSEKDKGSVFTVFFPAYEKQRDEKKKVVIQDKQNGTILLVDDEEILLRAAVKYLKRKGYNLLKAVNGFECLEVYKNSKEPIDLVILDISMPVMDGIECFSKLLEIDPNVKVVFSSGHNMSVQLPTLKKSGAIGAIQKPYRLNELTNMINEIVSK
jgi:signal transduction histidine kinase